MAFLRLTLPLIEKRQDTPDVWTLRLDLSSNPVEYKAGQFVEVGFNEAEAADSVVIETAPNQWGIRLKLEGRDASGQWKLLAPAPLASEAPVPPGLRRAAAEELRRRGIDYLLIFDGGFGADDLARNAGLWGIRQVGEYKGARLYRLP